MRTVTDELQRRLSVVPSPMVKTASRRMMKYLSGLAPAKRMSTVRSLPPDLRATAAHKTIGRQAADVVKRMPNDHGHGSDHVFAVTRNFQNATRPRESAGYRGLDLNMRRQGTIGSLLHDVGRRYEDPVVARTGKKITESSPHYWHSESGARYAKRMIERNPYSRFLPADMGTNVKNMLRVHDTDAHAQFPQLTQRFLYDPRQVANRAMYAADKQDGLGTMGALRTLQTGHGYGQTVGESTAYAMNKNMPKYQRVINEYATPSQQLDMQRELGNYSQAMTRWNQLYPDRIPDNVDQLNALLG